jgi:hypothetical protein
VTEWAPYFSRGPLRVRETSCCGIYEWASEGGQYFVLRRTGDDYEESGRGRYGEARPVWARLLSDHVCARSRPLRR